MSYCSDTLKEIFLEPGGGARCDMLFTACLSRERDHLSQCGVSFKGKFVGLVGRL